MVQRETDITVSNHPITGLPFTGGPIEIRRERDAELVNRITNESDILPFIARHGHEIDWTPAVRGCVILSNGHDACMVLEESCTRAWQVTTIYGKTCRGRRAVETGLAMRAWMMPRYADVIFGSIPNGFRHALWFYRQLGGKQADSLALDSFVFTPQDNETLLVLRELH